MHPTAAALLDAHTRHVLNQLSGERFALLVRDEIDSYCNWAATQPIDGIVNEVQVRDFLVRNLLDVDLSASLRGQIRSLVQRALQSPLNENTAVEELLNVRDYDLIVARLISLEDLRRDLVRAVLSNPTYSDFLSDLLYQGIKDYLLEENVLAKKVPGMSSLVKMGKGVIGKMGNLDNALENTLKSYIQRNIRATVDMSERLIERALEAPKLQAIARHYWSRIKTVKLSEATRYVGRDDVDDSADIVHAVWNHLRQTEYARQLSTELVHAWFEEYGQRPLLAVLDDLGLDRNRLALEAWQLLLPFVEAIRASGHLEARVRAHLEPFYQSDAVAAMLATQTESA